jgi:hypothetical protein
LSTSFEFFQSACEREPIVMLVNSFFDESGKFNDHRVVSFCGVCLTPHALKMFDEKWESLLRVSELPFLTMKRALEAHRQLSAVIPKQEPKERIEALKPFADCIRDHIEMGVAIAIDVEGFSQLSEKAKKKLGHTKDPHYISFLQAIVAVVSTHAHEDDRVNLICDDEEATALPCYHFYRRVKKIEPEARKKMVALSFADDQQFPGLQASDMLSSLVRLEACRRFFRWHYDYHDLFSYLTSEKQGVRWAGAIYTKSKLKDLERYLESDNWRKSLKDSTL